MNNDLIKKHILIFKNDAVGDLTHSLHAINNIIETCKNSKITIYLSERSKNFSFLIKNINVTFKIINYDLTTIQKIQIFYFIFTNKISKIYILTPKSFYFLLAPIFKKIKFYALCINGPNNYRRPIKFLRKYLFKYVVNDRAAIFKRDSTVKLQSELTKNIDQLSNEFKFNTSIKISDLLKKYLPQDYIYFHIKKTTVDKLGWGINELTYLFNELLKHYEYVIFTKDIKKDFSLDIFKDKFNVLDFLTKKFIKKDNNIILFDNIEGEDLFNTIRYSSKILAFHGMMTNLGSLEKKPIIDLWYCDINNWDDYRNYRNAFYEFKPKYPSYKFIIPNKDIKKTLRKMLFALQND
jgi:hypothetical protein